MSNGAGAPAEHRPTTVPARRTVRARRPVPRGLTAVLLLCLTMLGLLSAAGAVMADDQLVKVYVVTDPAQTGGQPDTLQSVAGATLGDASRSAEIFDLNRGRTQQDGNVLNAPADALHPGWILRLPQDATGPDVQLARDGNQKSGAEPAPEGSTAAADDSSGSSDSGSSLLSVPLPAAVAAISAVLLALVTAAIVGRRSVGRGAAAVGRAFRRLGEPARQRRRLAARQALGQAFAADTESVRGAYQVLDEFAATPRGPERPVHALSAGNGQVTAWLQASDSADAPWERLDGTRWRRPADAPGRPGAAQDADVACLTRVGADDEQRPVLVDLSWLDGVLSVTGDAAVARDVVQNLLTEIARSRPGLPVTVLRDGTHGRAFTVPQGMVRHESSAGARSAHRAEPRRITVGAAVRRRVGGVVVLAGTPSEQENAELAALCGPGGAGWTGLVCGEVDGAHWRWYADALGQVELPVLDMTLTVPA